MHLGRGNPLACFAIRAIVLALCGALLVYLSTAWGLAVSYDSFAYLHVARNVLEGHGFSLWTRDGYRAMAHWPPLYPAALAALGAGLGGARALQAGLFAANLLLAAGLTRRLAGGAGWGGLIVAALLLFQIDILTIHTAAWSEPLFLLLATGGLWMLGEHLRAPAGAKLLGAAALVGFAVLTRYSGLALLIAAPLALLLRRRFRESLVFIAVAALPIAAWLVRNHYFAATATDRHFAWHRVGLADVRFALSTISFWIAPRGVPATARGGILLLFLIAIVALKRRARPPRPPLPAERLLLLFVLAYVGFVIFSRCFFDAAIPLDARLLSPVLYAGTILAAAWLSRRWAGIGTGRQVVAGAVVLLLSLHVIAGAKWLYQFRRDGAGYTSRAWITSPLLARVRALPADQDLYTNAMIPIAFHTGRWYRGIPQPIDRLTARPDPAYRDNFATMTDDLHHGRALLAYFNLPGAEPDPAVAAIVGKLNLQAIYRAPDGILYAAPAAP